MRIRSTLIALVAVGTLLAGCTSGDDNTTEETSDGSTDTPEEVPTGPSPGVTDDAIKVGITYVDLEAIADIVDIDHGDYEKSFQVLIDDINANGGINGRTIEPVFAPINPAETASAEEACTKLTQDEQVFLAMGFFLDDAVLCPLELHQTAVIGGVMTPERLERAEAPWYTAESGADLQAEIIRTMAEEGELDGTVGVVVNEPQGEAVLSLLEELDVEVADQALQEAQSGELDVNQAIADMQIVAERFESSGVDQVLAVDNVGLAWAQGIEALDYRPQLLLTNPTSVLAYTGDEAGRDLSVMDDAVAGNPYGAAAERLGAAGDAGLHRRPRGRAASRCPNRTPIIEEGGLELFVAPMAACNVVSLFRALVEAAGEDLNYGSLAAAADGLEVELANQPEPVTYGPPPSADGDIPAYLYDWDPEVANFVLRDD